MTQGISNYKTGDFFEGFLLIKTATKGTTNNGDPYLSLQLGDASGTIEAKFWNVSENDIQTYTAGTVVEIKGMINEYRGTLQLQLQRIQISYAASKMPPEDLMEKAPISKEELQDEIEDTIVGIENNTLRLVTRSFIERYYQEFFVYPAASTMHHAFISGLAYHTVTMLRIAKSLTAVYPNVNKDLLYAGVILHDIGKIHEFESETNATYTRNGNLLGHIPMMVAEIREVAKEIHLDVDAEEVVLLQHMVLSHHGRPEWGSARTPLLLEAELLHMIDNMDAKVNMAMSALDKTEPGTNTGKIFGLDNRSFYKPLC